MINLIEQFQKDAYKLNRDANNIEELKRWLEAMKKEAWFAGKEELVWFENLMRRQNQIYPDAADAGLLIPNEVNKDEARTKLIELMNMHGYKQEVWGDGAKGPGSGGTTTMVFIPIEEDEGLIDGIILIVSYNRDKQRKVEFISIEESRSRISQQELRVWQSKRKKGSSSEPL